MCFLAPFLARRKDKEEAFRFSCQSLERLEAELRVQPRCGIVAYAAVMIMTKISPPIHLVMAGTQKAVGVLAP
jgi:hypothetical protein